MEIERKYLINSIPFDLSSYDCHTISQAYLCTEPVVRIRQENDDYYMTYKSKGLMVREEYNLPLTKESYQHLLSKADGNVISKKRFLIPYTLGDKNYTIELDVFSDTLNGFVLAEVEFETEEDANDFLAPDWFDKDVTFLTDYHNSTLSRLSTKTKGADFS